MKPSCFATGILIWLATACAPPAGTGNDDVDAIIDLVVAEESPFHDCIEVRSKSGLVADFPKDFRAPNNGGWDVAMFSEPRVREAATKAAVSFKAAMKLEQDSRPTHLFGKPDAQNKSCLMSVSQPTFSGDFAFLSYMSPAGTVGTYALERSKAGWQVRERVEQGYW